MENLISEVMSPFDNKLYKNNFIVFIFNNFIHMSQVPLVTWADAICSSVTEPNFTLEADFIYNSITRNTYLHKQWNSGRF